jgi:hypothetical protein
MATVAAEIITERSGVDGRAAVRRTLRLGVAPYNRGDATTTLLLNISETGVLIETNLDLQVGETLQLDIPEASGATMRVVWREERRLGCEFIDAVPTAAVSAARLMSAIEARERPGQVVPTILDTPRQYRYGAFVDRTETAVVMVTGLVAIVAVVILIAAILTLL